MDISWIVVEGGGWWFAVVGSMAVLGVGADRFRRWVALYDIAMVFLRWRW